MTGKEMVKLLQGHGFSFERINGSHHIMKKGAIQVSVPVHAGKELGKGLEMALRKKAGIK